MSEKHRMLERMSEKLLREKKHFGSKKLAAVKQLTNWYLKVSANGKLVTHNDVAKFLEGLVKEGTRITSSTVGCYVSGVRAQLEEFHGKTLQNIPGEGWKIATESEKAVLLVRSARRTINHADRTMRLHAITKRSEIPGAVKKVFGNSAVAKAQVDAYHEKFHQLFSTRGAGRPGKALI